MLEHKKFKFVRKILENKQNNNMIKTVEKWVGTACSVHQVSSGQTFLPKTWNL